MISGTDLPLALGEVLLDLSAHRLVDVLVQCRITGDPGKTKTKQNKNDIILSVLSSGIQVSHLAVFLPRKAKALKPLGRRENKNWIEPD